MFFITDLTANDFLGFYITSKITNDILNKKQQINTAKTNYYLTIKIVADSCSAFLIILPVYHPAQFESFWLTPA